MSENVPLILPYSPNEGTGRRNLLTVDFTNKRDRIQR